jgi:hypothetical protein
MKTKIILCLSLISSLTFSQVNIYFGQKNLTYPQKGGIYETAEDLINDKVKDVGIYNQAYSKLKMGYQQAAHAGEINFGENYYKLKGAAFFGYKDDYGNRYRIVDGFDYIVLSAGSKWLYSFRYKNNLVYDDKVKNKIEKYGSYNEIMIWCSNGVNAEIIKIKKWDKTPSTEANGKLFMDDPEISKQYMSDVSDDYDPHYKKGCMDQLERIIHYTDVYNKKHSL